MPYTLGWWYWQAVGLPRGNLSVSIELLEARGILHGFQRSGSVDIDADEKSNADAGASQSDDMKIAYDHCIHSNET
jgi:hypothetical protein